MTGQPPVWPPVALYDANVLYPAFLRDVLMRLAIANVVAARWTAAIQDEWTRSLRANRPDIDPAAIVLISDRINQALPGALVTGYESRILEVAGLPDANDRHVLAAAVHCGAHFVVTNNLSDFPDHALRDHGIIASAPDAFVDFLFRQDETTILNALERHRLGLQRPAMTTVDYQGALIASGLPTVASQMVTRNGEG
jgi:hypothetical protein